MEYWDREFSIYKDADYGCEGNRLPVHLLHTDGTDVWVRTNVCSLPSCSHCVETKNRRIYSAILRHLGYNTKGPIWVVTLSVPNSPILNGAFNALQHNWKKMVSNTNRDAKHPWNSVAHYVGATEIKRGAGGWNVHRHLIVTTKRGRWDWQSLHRQWGDKNHLNIKRLNSHRGAASYIGSYISKGYWGGMTQDEAFQMRFGLKGRNRILRSRGSMPPHTPQFFFCCNADRDQCANPDMTGYTPPSL